MDKSKEGSDKSILEKNVISYLNEHRQCVIGTSLNNIPFVAKVYYYTLKDYEIVFSTFPNSNKFRNLQNNPNIAIEIDAGSPSNCMHYQGKAELITSEEEISKLKTYILSKDAPFRKFMERPDLKFFKVKPRTIYYTDYKKKPFYRDILQFDDTMGIIDIDITNEKIF
jgi:nitroimidazol reductase NimA-like FMN-containing flavoprotein (pyridoxamine 5'-phosphate oxidase superfamily)